VISLDARIREMSVAAQKVTVSHRQALQLMGMIRQRAAEVCAKNGITDARAPAGIRAAIKKEVLQSWGIQDLHDLPLSAWDRAVWAVGSWSRYAIIKKYKYANGAELRVES